MVRMKNIIVWVHLVDSCCAYEGYDDVLCHGRKIIKRRARMYRMEAKNRTSQQLTSSDSISDNIHHTNLINTTDHIVYKILVLNITHVENVETNIAIREIEEQKYFRFQLSSFTLQLYHRVLQYFNAAHTIIHKLKWY